MPTTVKVGFSTSNKLVSRAIRFFTRGKVSHTWLLVSDSFLGEDMVMQATMGGFQMLTFEAFRKHHKIVAIFDLNHPIIPGIQRVTQWLGFRYDYFGFFGAAFVVMGRWFKRKWRNPFDDSNALFCSEVVVDALKFGGFPGTELFDSSTTDPQMLLAFLSASKDASPAPLDGL